MILNEHGFGASVIADSKNPAGVRLCTLQLRYPRFIHAEFMTHRVFSRNASSSRAIPVAKMIDQVRSQPAMPIHWGKNQPGMQADEELTGEDLSKTQELWKMAAFSAACMAGDMVKLGAHKQVANRILEPFQFINVIVTATEWENFFELRDHEDAEPNIQHLARLMRAAMDTSTPIERPYEPTSQAGWHLPYITDEERWLTPHVPLYLAKLSVARCARVSYLTHEGKTPSAEEDMKLYERLVGSKPLHASPAEHQAVVPPTSQQQNFCRNLKGWWQMRECVEQGAT